MLQVRKRNGILVPFDKERIINAINKAFIGTSFSYYFVSASKLMGHYMKMIQQMILQMKLSML